MASGPAHAGGNYQAVLDQLRWFAGTQIRNVGAMGSNVANASPISDLNPVLMASGATITLVNTANETRTVPAPRAPPAAAPTAPSAGARR